jgi:hypothetical protein
VADDDEGRTTVGVLLTPRHDGLRDWDTSMAAVSGPIELSEADLALYRETWGSSGLPDRGGLGSETNAPRSVILPAPR